MTLMGYYIMILIVPFSVIMILCFLGTYLVKSEIITANQIIVRQFQSEVDSKLKEFQRCNVYVQQEEKLVDIDFSEGRMDAKQIFDIVQVNEQLSKVILADSLIQDYMIYLPDQLMIHSGGYYYLDRFYSFWDEQLLAEIPDYRRILKQNYNSRIFTTYDESGIKNIYYFDTMKGSFFKNKGYQFILKSICLCQLVIILYDSIMDQGHLTRPVGMGILIGHTAVGCPARMPDAAV